MDTAIYAAIGGLLALVSREIVAAVIQLRKQSYEQAGVERGERVTELENVITRHEALYDRERKDRQAAEKRAAQLSKDHNDCQRRMARYEVWAEMVAEDLRRAGIAVRPLSLDGSGSHRPLSENESETQP